MFHRGRGSGGGRQGPGSSDARLLHVAAGSVDYGRGGHGGGGSGRGGPVAAAQRLPRRLLHALVTVQALSVSGLLAPGVLARWFVMPHGNDVAAVLSWAGMVATGLAAVLLVCLSVVWCRRRRCQPIRHEPRISSPSSHEDNDNAGEGTGAGAAAYSSSSSFSSASSSLAGNRIATIILVWALLGGFLTAHMTHTLGTVPLMSWLVRPAQCRRWQHPKPASSLRQLPTGRLRARSAVIADGNNKNNENSSDTGGGPPDLRVSAAAAAAWALTVPHVCLVTGPIAAEATVVPGGTEERFRAVGKRVLAQKVAYAKAHPHTSVFTFDRAFVEAKKVPSQISAHLRRFWAKPASLLEVMTHRGTLAGLPGLVDAGTYVSPWGASGPCDWVVWMDLDTVIMTPERSLQSLVGEFGVGGGGEGEGNGDGGGFDVVIGDEAGMVFLRNGPAAVSLVRQWLGTPAGVYGDGLDDGALQHWLAEGSAAGTLQVRRAAPCEFNAYFPFWDVSHRWTCGDFALHAAGDRWKMERLPVLVEMARAGRCWPPWAWTWR